MFLFNKEGFQFLKYGMTGGIGACIDFGLYSLFVNICALNYLFANAISFSLGTLFVFFIQKNWTFKFHTEKNAILFSKFLLVVLGTYLFNNVMLIFFVELLRFNLIISKVFQIFLSFLWGYFMNKKFVFKK